MNTELINHLNTYLADIHTLYIKLHCLHWNVVGKQFKTIHEYLESIYKNLSNYFDETAEAIKMHNSFPLASASSYIKSTTIVELNSKNYSTDDVLIILKEDLSHIKLFIEKIRMQADLENIYDIVSMLENHLNYYSKTLWFLNSMIK